MPPDFFYLTLAAKYWSKTLGTFDRTFALVNRAQSSYETLVHAVTDIGAELQ